jgi:hypothetical protein
MSDRSVESLEVRAGLFPRRSACRPQPWHRLQCRVDRVGHEMAPGHLRSQQYDRWPGNPHRLRRLLFRLRYPLCRRRSTSASACNPSRRRMLLL